MSLSEESSSEQNEQLYAFLTEEKDFITGLELAIRCVLSRPQLTPKEIYLCAVVLRALERMPLVTPTVGLCITLSEDQYDGSSGCLSLKIDEESVCLSTGETIYDPLVGSDSKTQDIAEVGVGWRSEFVTGSARWLAEFTRRAGDSGYKVLFEDFVDSHVDWSDDSTGDRLWQSLDTDEE